MFKPENTVGKTITSTSNIIIDPECRDDEVNRAKLREWWESGGAEEEFEEVLWEDLVLVEDGVVEHKPIRQTIGVARGDCLSPLLFSTLVGDLPKRIRDRHPQVQVLMYADDLALFSSSRFHLQQALRSLERYVVENDIEINASKSEALKSRRGGRPSSSDQFRIDSDTLELVDHFPYLGIFFSAFGCSFSRHLRERVHLGHFAFHCIENPHKLSLRTAEALFTLKIEPTACYGTHRMQLDRLKVAFLKTVFKCTDHAETDSSISWRMSHYFRSKSSEDSI
ncbi:uncharacterized protein LOC100907733 [Galendromus occidentalis]|uniref:Uncharacterized protein LOC100907733 n=1 Tax=Galendromus occidentalis TaxID=34638 RepID=A0AAJ6QN29_9ACAR|nr:uncharacterized protein LOC100907733 [Galendromus occidentalis]